MVRGLQLAEQQAGDGEGMVGSSGGRGIALRRLGGWDNTFRSAPFGGADDGCEEASRKEAASLLGGDADSEGEGEEEAGKLEVAGGGLLPPAAAAERR